MKFAKYTWTTHVGPDGAYDLSHLDAFDFVFTAPARPGSQGRAPRQALGVRVNVAFSHHCFTVATGKPCSASENMYGYRADYRSFCPVRYAYSKRLPAYVKQFGRKRCYRTRYSNYFVAAETVESGGWYVVYFRMFSCGGDTKAVNLLVESAYVKSSLPSARGDAHQEPFAAIVHRYAEGSAK